MANIFLTQAEIAYLVKQALETYKPELAKMLDFETLEFDVKNGGEYSITIMMED